MRNETHYYQDRRYKRVSKSQARKTYNNGDKILLLPVYANFNSVWVHPYPTWNDIKDSYSFDTLVNEYEYYNCNNELGTYSKFYIELRNY